MSEASIIQQLTLNQATTFTTTTSVNRVKIHNDSSYYLRVYFGIGAPSRPDSGGWHDTISPGASPVVAVVGAAKSVQGLDLTNSQQTGTYQGQIIVLPFLPTGAPTPGGVVTGAALCYLTGYYPDEYAETAGQVEAFVQAAKQGRYQSVLGAMTSHAGAPVYTDETTADGTVLIGPMLQITTTGAPNLFLANAAGQSRVNLYMWDYVCTMRCRTPAVARVNAWVSAVVTTNAFVVKAETSLLPLELSAVNFGADRFLFMPSRPMFTGLILAQNTLVSGDLAGFRYHFDTAAAHANIGSFELAHVFSFQIDVINQSPLYGLSIPNNVVSVASAPFDPVFNPQTY